MNAADPAPKTRRQRHIQSIEVGFRLIRVLEDANGKLPLGVIAELADMPASKAHLYLVSFVRLELVEQDPHTARYGLGPYALRLGAAALRQLDVAQLARQAMDELQAETGLLIFLSVWGNRGPVIISKVDSMVDVPVSVRVGYVLPLHQSATGRVFLAYKSRAASAHALALAREPVDPASRQRALETLPLVKRRRMAFSDGQLHTGFASVSAPIFDYAGEIAAAITALGMRNDVDLDPLGKVAQAVGRAASAVSAKLANEQEPHSPGAARPALDEPV